MSVDEPFDMLLEHRMNSDFVDFLIEHNVPDLERVLLQVDEGKHYGITVKSVPLSHIFKYSDYI